MYATIRQYTVERGKLDDVSRDVREKFLPQISTVPGFISYEVVESGDRLTTVSLFESKDGAAESTRRAADFLKDQKGYQLSKPQITEGEVRVHKFAEPGVAAGPRH